jgi:hypothetical protein
MDKEIPTRRAFRPLVLWVVFGAVLELTFIPRNHAARIGSSLLVNGDFFYALLSPVVVWWFFRRLISARAKELEELGLKGVRLMNFVLGFYVASALRAVLSAFFAIRLGMWR